MRSTRTAASAGIVFAFAFGLVSTGTVSASANEAASVQAVLTRSASSADALPAGVITRTDEVPWT
ncbi:hypothetical protein PV355_29115 [Streptomyces stelliscabiei]|uniref:Uncharacterized protein n=1 Tax=Streptomyces stelliscabiei TaxID=146820 RepID=A0A8I0PEF9_9ACTN|nr:hypothetical protein [Streptomyces stelliscabiei]MBE1600870.1 hypothetical protein [Streptomyces stelliscabiei]MDX2519153.1 hypothetical protein [Streptomyces stelliscabiei]SOD69133.1 hypothetical protein SAMN06272781_2010 [Streptomyces sp. 1222.2]